MSTDKEYGKIYTCIRLPEQREEKAKKYLILKGNNEKHYLPPF